MVEKTIIEGEVYYLYSPKEHERVELLEEIVSTTRELFKEDS